MLSIQAIIIAFMSAGRQGSDTNVWDDIITMATSLAQQVVGELELHNTIFLCIDTTLTFCCLTNYKTWKMIVLYVQTKSAIKAEIAT